MRARLVVLAAGIVLLGVMTAAPATAAPRQAAACDPASAAELTAVQSSDGAETTFTVGNALPLCEAVPIGVAVYLKDGPDFVVPQDLFGSATDTITTGSKTLSLTLPLTGTAPRCFTQVDAFTGPVLPAITETDRYGDRLLAYLFSTVPTCGDVDGATTTTTTTSTTTTTTTEPTTTTVRTTSRPAAVLGTQVTRPTTTTAAVSGRALARTGTRGETVDLLRIGLALVLLGGLLVVGGYRARRRLIR